MTVKQLKEIINDLPGNMEVFMYERQTEFAYGLVNNAIVKDIKFTEEPYPDYTGLLSNAPSETVLVLTEE